jgi:hypothetical protein
MELLDVFHMVVDYPARFIESASEDSLIASFPELAENFRLFGDVDGRPIPILFLEPCPTSLQFDKKTMEKIGWRSDENVRPRSPSAILPGLHTRLAKRQLHPAPEVAVEDRSRVLHPEIIRYHNLKVFLRDTAVVLYTVDVHS